MSLFKKYTPLSIRSSIFAFSILFSFSAYALEFDVDIEGIGAVNAEFKTQLTIGAAWRLNDRDKNQLGQANLGLPLGGTIGSPTNNTDDGNWNFDKGDTYSKVIKGLTEFTFGNESFGLVSGVKYFYDVEIKDESRAADDTGYTRKLIDETLDSAGSDIELLNAYFYGTFDLGRPVSMKLGRQVLSWGEGIFMQGGVNAINPVDLSAARVPGARLKEIFLPVNMVSASFDLSDSLSMEAFIQLDWEPIELDGCGTFFSFNDTISDGCGPIIISNTPDSATAGLVATNTAILPRIDDSEPRDSGQFGVALHWYLEQFNGSELGFYYMQYHSRLPYFSGVVADPFQVAPTELLPIVGLPSYYREYPEEIRLWGLSLSSTIGDDYSIAADYSFRENLPIQWNSSEIIHGGLLSLYSRHLQQRMEEAGATSVLELAGTDQKGYDRYKVSQLQLSAIRFFDHILGADQLRVIAEAGGVYIHGFPSETEARYGRPDAFGIGDFTDLTTFSCSGEGTFFAISSNPSFCDNQGYTTAFSWGYVLAMQLNYQGVFTGTNLYPELFFSHDVNGNSPEPMGLFKEGRKSIGLSLNADYLLNRYQTSLAYVHYYGGGRDNLLNDRDHLAASVSVLF